MTIEQEIELLRIAKPQIVHTILVIRTFRNRFKSICFFKKPRQAISSNTRYFCETCQNSVHNFHDLLFFIR